jgi:AAA domain
VKPDPLAAADAAWDHPQQHPGPNGADIGRLQLVHWRDMGARLSGRPLIKGLLERGQISLIVGESGSGKTFFALDLALHVAADMDWFGRRVTAGAVVYVAAEAGGSIANRVVAWREHHQLSSQNIPFAALTSPIDLCHADAGDLDRLIMAIRSAGFYPVLVVIDTVSRVLAGGNENAPDDMGALVRSLDRLRDELGCHVSAVHHLGKDASRGSRGHSLLHCAVDTELAVTRDDSSAIATATVTKQRDNIAGQQIAFRLRPIELGRDDDGDPVTSCVAEPVDAAPAGRIRDRPVKRLPDSARVALDALRRAIVDAGETAPPSNHIPAGAIVINNDLWRRYYLSGSNAAGQSEDTRRKAWRRASDTLLSNGYIRMHNEMVWIV